MSDRSRRRLIQMGGTALATALAGCSNLNPIGGNNTEPSFTHDPDGPASADYNETQEYTIPPVAELSSDGVPNENNVVKVKAIFDSIENSKSTPHRRLMVYFDDELTFELFVYDTHPVGNELDLTKVAEMTSTPVATSSQTLEVNYEDLPKNKQMRFRLRVTNNNTGDSEWQMDQRVFHYGEFGDVTVAGDGPYSIIEGGDDELTNGLEQSGDTYIIDISGGSEFPVPEFPEEVPFSREAFKLESEEHENYGIIEKPVCVPFKGRRIEVPADAVELSSQLKENYDPGNYYNSFDFEAPVPSNYDYYGKNLYSVLDNPLYQNMAEIIHEAHSLYGVNNHYSKIKQATRMIQANEYEAVPNPDRAPVYLPEEYWTNPATNCVGHSFQLCWFLYHLGYTCGTVWLSRTGRNASHLGVGMPIPEDVLESDFPEGYPETFQDAEVPDTYYIYTISDRVGPDSRPETTGEYRWVYIEATSPTAIGVIPFDNDTIDQRRIRFAIEPEDNVFGTDIGAPNNREEEEA